MPAITAANVLVVIREDQRAILGPFRVAIGSLIFGDGALTYPVGGIPLPRHDVYGFAAGTVVFSIFGQIHPDGVTPIAAGELYLYDPNTNRLILFQDAIAEAPATHVLTSRTLRFLAIGW